ncbi:MAG TPA: hypothetical protein VFB20_11720 [Burkholderiales bacterium]|nr:hypothetical protein [Burkholderiales bacterium]
MAQVTAADRQKAKLAVLFSTLGLLGFMLNIVAGFWLWTYAASKRADIPAYDRFVAELHVADAAALPRLATSMFEKWSACESSRRGMTEVALHAVTASSFVAIALFALVLLLSVQLYRKLDAIVGSHDAPQPPEPVDDTWRGQ